MLAVLSFLNNKTAIGDLFLAILLTSRNWAITCNRYAKNGEIKNPLNLLKKQGAKIKFSNTRKENNEIRGNIFVQSSKMKPIIAGKEYGSGSSRDWAAKGPKLQGVAAVLTESFERIHRSNLVGMGILPLQFKDGENADTYSINGTEEFTISGIKSGEAKTVKITADNGIEKKSFEVNVRIDTPQEVKYFKSGGILQYVLKQIAA